MTPSAAGFSTATPHDDVTLLDASALLALVMNEEGAARVENAVASGAAITVVNLAEVLSTLAQHGQDPEAAFAILNGGGAIEVVPVTAADAVEAAKLRPLTARAGLSLADRLCLAVAKRLDVTVLTADQAWLAVPVGVRAVSIRGKSDGDG